MAAVKFWIGGSPCSGKSSIAERLCQKHNLRSFSCDDAYWRHSKAADPAVQPVLHRIGRMSWEEIWLRPVEQLLDDEIKAYHEQFPLLMEDLRSLPAGAPVLAEGAALLPELVAPLLEGPSQAVWIVPSPEFQLRHYAMRGWAQDLVRQTSDPKRAFQNWMERDIRFAAHARRQAETRGLRVLVVDGSAGLDENLAFVEEHFELQD